MDKLERVPVSLSEQLTNGVSDFLEMGMNDAYAGSPADSTVKEGLDSLDKLAIMIATEVSEHLALI